MDNENHKKTWDNLQSLFFEDNFSHCYFNTSSYFLTIIKMIVGSINEDRNIESRVAITPENVKKFIGLGFKVLIEKNYARHLGIDDDDYVSLGAEISEDKKKNFG